MILRNPRSHAAVVRRVRCWLVIAIFVALSDARGDGGAVLARESVGSETYVLLGNRSGLQIGFVDLDLVVEGKNSKGDPLEITFRQADGHRGELTVIANPQSLGNTVLFRLHVELKEPGHWKMSIPTADGENVEWTIDLREAKPIAWQMAAWYLWPFVAVTAYLIRELAVRSRLDNAHRPRIVDN